MGYHSVKFGGQRRSGRGNIMGFVCRMILKDHMIKRPHDHNPTKFSGHRPCGSGDVIVLVYHVISQDQ